MKNKKGYVLLETIVVITVLCIIMIMLYGSYTSILMKVQKKSYYDNTDYIYRTTIIREYLEQNLTAITINIDAGIFYDVICSNYVETNKCHSDSLAGYYSNQLYKFLEVDAIYIMSWKAQHLSNYSELEPTTQNYIDYLDPVDIGEVAYRIIVMYEKTDDDKSNHYASLRYGSRG